MTPKPLHLTLIGAAAQALKDRKDEVNKLNVFPVPDGDTGTNMSLTMDAVIAELQNVEVDASLVDICHAITQGSLMGARGNSGVILSQILRGLCDVIAMATSLDCAVVSNAFTRAESVAFQAVRKPVEGTMLTVLRDCAAAAKTAAEQSDDLNALLESVVHEAFESVRRTPDLLPVLRENDVVDAGGYGLAILAEGLLAAYKGEDVQIEDVSISTRTELTVEPADDWDDDEYLYCTEFLLLGDDLDRESIHRYVTSQGGSELVVGDEVLLKIHVHTDDPGTVLSYMTALGQLADVHIHNMRRQSQDRSAALRSQAEDSQVKPYGIVTVAAGEGIKQILISLGADVVVSGGQTMNPSTAELLKAAESVNAERILILPNNKNIHMAAQQAIALSQRPLGVVPTNSVPEAFSALLTFDEDAELSENIEAMTESTTEVRTGEVTTAIKDSKAKAGKIKAGDIIGIADHEIEVVGNDVLDVAVQLVEFLLDDGETVTLLAGENLTDEQLKTLTQRLESAHPDLVIEPHRGDQPLYPLVLSVE